MREIHCQGDAPGIGYRGQDCRNVTIHPPDNAFPGSCTQSRERHLYGSSTQSLTRNSGGAVCARGMKLLSQSFLSSQCRNHSGQSCCSWVQPVPVPGCAHPSGLTPVLGTTRTPHSACPSSQAGQNGITSASCSAGPGASPAPAQADSGLKLLGTVSHPCPHVIPLVTRTPEEPFPTLYPILVPMSFLWSPLRIISLSE